MNTRLGQSFGIHAGLLALAVSWCAGLAHGGPKSSTDYSVVADTTDAGGQCTTSVSYSHDGSLGVVVGISTVAAPAAVVKHGYIGQLYDVAALQLAAASPTVNETGTLQFDAFEFLDDETSLPVNRTSVIWSVMGGPFSGIDAGGLAAADAVHQDSLATVRGDHAGLFGTLGVTVLDSIPDNFGDYAGDGLGDDWQVLHFGQPPNADAAPDVDFDHDGQDNRFEFTANLDPKDPASRFTHRIDSVPGQPTQKRISFGPVFGSRSYRLLSTSTLAPGPWPPLATGSAPTDNGNERSITDLNASGTTKFYQVEITKP